jgi:hypothetical protein
MPSLIETNPYLRDPELRKRMLMYDTYQSSVFEGARGIPRPAQPVSRKRRTSASAKNAAKSSYRCK